VHKTSCAVELEGEEISLLFEVLVEGLCIIREQGFQSEEEKTEYQRIVSVVNRLFEPVRKTTTLSPSYVQTLERLKGHLGKQQTTHL